MNNIDLTLENSPVDYHISMIKKSMLGAITVGRTSKLNQGIIFADEIYDISSTAVANLSAAIMVLRNNEPSISTIAWRTVDNKIIQHDIESLSLLLNKMVMKTQEIFEESWALKDELTAKTTMLEIMNWATDNKLISKPAE